MKVLLLLATFLTFQLSVIPNTIYVPDDYSTIQGAIDAAVVGDIIVVKPGTYVENIDFLGKDIVVRSEQGPGVTVIDGNSNKSCVQFKSGEGEGAILSGFILTGGIGTNYSAVRCGGAIYCYNSSPLIVNNIITGNSSYIGGGIACFGVGVPKIVSNKIYGNSAGHYGGGINVRSAIIQNNNIYDNSANSAGSMGGGIYVDGESSIYHNEISSNSAVDGGGIALWKGEPANVFNNIFNGNSANSEGGGILIHQCSGTSVCNNVFIENTASNGGGMHCGWNLTLEIENNLFTENSADAGGSIFCNDSKLQITNNTITSNVASMEGGGVYVTQESVLNVTNTILWDNSAPYGPEIWIGKLNYPSSLDISYSDIMGGYSSVFIDTGSTVNCGPGMLNSDPFFFDPSNRDYHLRQWPVQIWVHSPCVDAGDPSSPQIEGTTRTDREPDTGIVDMGFHYPWSTLYVPAPYSTIQSAIDAAQNWDTVVVFPGTYVENLDFLGKDILVTSDGGAGFTIIDGNQSGPVATFQTGESEKAVLEGFTIRNGLSNYGGGIYCNYFSSPRISDCVVTENTAVLQGGGVYCSQSCPIIEDTQVTNNLADSGAGLSFQGGSAPTVVNTTISKNSAAISGGAASVGNSDPIITNCTITDNIASQSGGGLILTNSSPRVTNVILWDDDAPANPEMDVDSTSNPNITYCDISGGWTGTGNIDADPMFKDSFSGDYHLKYGSPCFNAGDKNLPEIPEYDFEGDPRVAYNHIDIGIDECKHPTIYHVPGLYPTIQEAIDAAGDGIRILVGPGTYVENINFLGKKISVTSTDGPQVTIIDGSLGGSVVTFEQYEDRFSVLDGFTLTGGTGNEHVGFGRWGGGIECYCASPTIRNNIIKGNSATRGGGIYIKCHQYTGPHITGNVITDNFAVLWGGGLSIFNDSYVYTFDKNIIQDNISGERGGGLYCYGEKYSITNSIIRRNIAGDSGAGLYCNSERFELTNILIINNIAGSNGGGTFFEPTHGESCNITNCTVSRNSPCGMEFGFFTDGNVPIYNTIFWDNHLGEIWSPPGGTPYLYWCDIEGGWQWGGQNNMDENPLFVDRNRGDFHLAYSSPCRDAGNNTFVSTLSEDFEGNPRIVLDTVDIGADEFYYHLYHTGSPTPGNTIDLKVIGYPQAPITLAWGQTVLDPPFSTQHGDLYIWPFVWSGFIGNVQSNGVLAMPVTIPSSWQLGDHAQLQALVGPWGGGIYSKLTNLDTVTVE